jgi:hypothetical protein
MVRLVLKKLIWRIKQMKRNRIKLGIVSVMLTISLGSAYMTRAYPPFVKKAEKFGAKDCAFCHADAKGGEGWNERGQWLAAEKKKRKAKAVDPEWLSEYK